MIDSQWIIQLKGKSYPLYAGLLDAATRAGLKELSCKLLQFPSPENGQLAIVEALAVFEDGRTFADLGDAGPQNCSPQIASAAVRMASTRAKGRALRDALNIGQTMYEELPDGERSEAGNGHGAAASKPQRARHDPQDHAEQQPNQPVCSEEGCSETLSPSLVALCRRRGATLEGRFLCAVHLEEYARAYKARQAEAGSA